MQKDPRLSRKNYAILAALFVFVLTVFCVTIIRIKG